MSDLVWVAIFFPKSGDSTLILTYNGVRIFFPHYTP